MTLVIGLTGGIATGKSTVAKLLHQAGWPVIDADQVAREVVEPGTVGLAKLQQAFGTQIITAGGTLDRAKLSQIIFQAAEQRQRLNTILHPLIEQAVDQQLSQFQRLQTPVVVLDVPLLYESGWDKKCDQVWVVATDETTQLQRLMARNHLQREEAQARINAQLPLSQKCQAATVVINNQGDQVALQKQVTELMRQVTEAMA
ncbi:dephospho-CoA kinase [Limosilactobacillus equigenerosi]|uniref:Dephospho-CoA kinase n=1 Tax=Limosilactobacillus equigenerosi DSM 18793 = JCM 14505 TaxID=1423742 RepID=A0A0R1UQW6_9LACO|nr:dephospho-CoA kinase [Limosilactobacillus equigenerosi]KRL92235.1 dephospho-CoA kinase [Limosilactobacillus equigenerosi DSM 18793 = JCM 14505]